MARRSRQRSNHGQQTGLTLIELMVGLVIGLLVVVAAMGSMAHTRTASHVIGDSARLQQEAATAFRLIGVAARQAGARRLTQGAEGGLVVFNPAYTGFGLKSDTQQPMSIRGMDGKAGQPDTLDIQRDNDAAGYDNIDCLGEVVGPPLAVTSTFSVVNGSLGCDGSSDGRTQNIRVVSGVEDFQAWYGLRNGDDVRYMDASALSALTPAPWDQVESIRVCLRLVGELVSHRGSATTGCQGETIANDGRLRRAFFRVFHLRNANP